MKTCIVNECDVDAALDAEIKRGLCRCFPGDVATFSRTRAWHESQPAWTGLIMDGEQVIAHVGVTDRHIRVGDSTVRVAGVENVFVLPEHRGKGYVDQVLNAAMEEGMRRGFDAGFLFCHAPVVPVYLRTGWFRLENRSVTRVDREGQEKSPPDINLVMVKLLHATAFPDGAIHLQGDDW